ncbi:unnamed protein product [Arctogadus glacialis]
MVVEVGGLRSQLEKEKSRFKSMQTDLQKELTMAFKENTKLTALLDGVELSSSHQQMVVEVGGLRSQLEKEKSRFKSMQTDLQKELTMAFKENTKLTALLDGVELSSSHQQMVVEVGGLRSQLEKEKSRFKSMQTDLQKELTMAFKENTKLTALLDGVTTRLEGSNT